MEYLTRPKPDSNLILEVCGNNYPLLNSICFGLKETPLKEIYPYLNLEETLIFAGTSWKNRKYNPDFYNEIVKGKPKKEDIRLNLFDDEFTKNNQDILYDIFNETFKTGFGWLRNKSNISDEKSEKLKKYAKMNPFSNIPLKERLNRVNDEDIETLKNKLLTSTKNYIFEKDYRGGTYEKNQVVMKFQPVYSNKGDIKKNYALEIMRILKDYPTKYLKIENTDDVNLKDNYPSDSQENSQDNSQHP